ncbi:alpha-galactosidase [Anaeromassilibacillus sp. An172]|uniref:alpha-galactosidase n=1 Tax=Anaeromassilibacillus sp. An172 TaxID=1965570 RepID=UPI00194F0EC2|nr:alpha-galactosidase [Anaeromassilibacillus sp. An172]
MSISVNEKEKFFSVKTANTEYQMKVDEFGVLKHIWYGEITNKNMEYLLDYPNVGFSGSIYEAGTRQTYSLDTLPQEYSCEGTGDYRISSLSVLNKDGDSSVDLRFKGWEVKKGKYSIPGLPASYDNSNEAETLEITLEDKVSKIEVVLKYGVFENTDIITRSAVITNKGDNSVYLKNASSVCLDIPFGNWQWVHFQGRHAMERQLERASLIHGVQESSSNRGASSHQQNPAIVLCSADCTEISGSCIGAMLMYSGSFKARVQLDQIDQVRMVMGINPEMFKWNLKAGESFYTPEAFLSFSSQGFEKLSHCFHKFIRNNVCRGKYKLESRPVLINNWEATYFDFNEEILYNIAKQASELGVDMFVLDDGWFGQRNGETAGLGDWFVNEEKLSGSLKKFVDKVKAMGMKFGLWFEPEMVSEDSDLYRNHPDWAIKIPDRAPVRSRCQLVLDMSRKDVQDYIYEAVSNVLKSADISYVKWDMNRSISDWFSHGLNSENMGEMPHRYVLGVYSLLERLTSSFPDVLFEGCCGGGGRFDAGMLYYCPQIWCSDDTDAYERTKIQYGTSFFYPISAVGSHVSTVPNHQTGRITPIETRAVTAMAGSFGYELDLNTLSSEEKESVKNQIKRFKEYQPLIHNGEYYRLSNPMEDEYAAWEFVSEDKSEALIHGMVFFTKPNFVRYLIKPRGLDENAEYVINNGSETYTGKALMSGGVLVPKTSGDYSPIEMHIAKLLS